MEWIVTAGIVGFVFYRFTRMGGGCCGGHGSHGGHGSSHGKDAEAGSMNKGEPHFMVQDADTATDPVCGMEVAKKGAVSKIVNGETFYFCCKGCAKTFAG